MGVGGCHAEIEHIILADLGALPRQMQRTVGVAQHIIAEKAGIQQRMGADIAADAFCLLVKRGQVVEVIEGIQHGCVEGVGGEVDVLAEVIGVRPLDKYPGGKMLQQSVGIFVRRKELVQGEHFILGAVDQRMVAAADEIFLQLKDVPHGPVGIENTVGMIGGVTHGQHSLGQSGEALGADKIIKEGSLDYAPSRQGIFHAGGEKAVA